MMTFKQAILCSLLIACNAPALADGARSGSSERMAAVRGFLLQRSAFDFGRGAEQGGHNGLQPGARSEGEQRGGRQPNPVQDSSGAGDAEAQGGNMAERRGGKLSPEERRALRRQIDEAGHDIYKSKR